MFPISFFPAPAVVHRPFAHTKKNCRNRAALFAKKNAVKIGNTPGERKEGVLYLDRLPAELQQLTRTYTTEAATRIRQSIDHKAARLIASFGDFHFRNRESAKFKSQLAA